ncbi:MAG: trehalose-phosphatase [Omnitrophica WOR_2 bacterium RBG_13_44_8b]|nr:MAG: trehalose-phosphatase [Omnitrophica WOR_2 bacterium RBG_13_44_8b]
MEYLFSKWDELREGLIGNHIYLFIDYDGTLTPIAECPDKAVILEDMRNLLRDLSSQPGCSVGIISGRALRDIKRMVGLEGIIYAGNHGLEIEGPKIKFESQISPRLLSIIRNLKQELTDKLSKIKGVFVEDKDVTLSIHYRLAARSGYLSARKIIEKAIQPFLTVNKIRVSYGKKVIELKPQVAWNKGRVVEWLLARQEFILGGRPVIPIYLGDDVTDEDAFGMLKNKGLTIYIGRPKKSQAKYYLQDTREVFEFLKKILCLCKN